MKLMETKQLSIVLRKTMMMTASTAVLPLPKKNPSHSSTNRCVPGRPWGKGKTVRQSPASARRGRDCHLFPSVAALQRVSGLTVTSSIRLWNILSVKSWYSVGSSTVTVELAKKIFSSGLVGSMMSALCCQMWTPLQNASCCDAAAYLRRGKRGGGGELRVSPARQGRDDDATRWIPAALRLTTGRSCRSPGPAR